MNPSSLKHKTIIVLSLIFIAFTLFLSIRYVIKNKNQALIIYEPGYQYANFLPHLKQVKRLGFLTNKPTSSESGFEDLLQAQYILAPRILDLNNSTYEYNILDYMVEPKDQIYVFYMLNKLQATKIDDNDWGRVLIRKNP